MPLPMWSPMRKASSEKIQAGTSSSASVCCAGSRSSIQPHNAASAQSSTAAGQCSWMLKICPTSAMAAPVDTVPTACSAVERPRKLERAKPPPTWKTATMAQTSA